MTSGGYVGLSIATLLSQHHKVTAVDIIPEKVDMINNRNTVTRLKWLTALTVDPEAKSQMLHLARKIETETEERWYEAFYHHLRMEMDEYRRIRRSLRALKANTDYDCKKNCLNELE